MLLGYMGCFQDAALAKIGEHPKRAVLTSAEWGRYSVLLTQQYPWAEISRGCAEDMLTLKSQHGQRQGSSAHFHGSPSLRHYMA